MNDFAIAVILVFGLLIGLPVAMLCVRDWVTRPSKQQIDKAHTRFNERLRNPDLPAVEKHFGHPLPECLRSFYEDRQELLRGDFETAAIPNPAADDRWYVSFYQPADAESVESAWPGTEKYFAFANDGGGNDYLIDPKEQDPAVLFHDHETGDIQLVCEHFTEFMKWPRMTSNE